MSKKKDRRKQKIDLAADAKGFGHNPFADRFGKPAEEAPPEPQAPGERSTPDEMQATDEQPAAVLSGVSKVVLRVERKGRGGKTVTAVEGLEALDAGAREGLAKALRKLLGVGASVEEARIVVQGDQRERLERWLGEQGVRRVVTSG